MGYREGEALTKIDSLGYQLASLLDNHNDDDHRIGLGVSHNIALDTDQAIKHCSERFVPVFGCVYFTVLCLCLYLYACIDVCTYLSCSCSCCCCCCCCCTTSRSCTASCSSSSSCISALLSSTLRVYSTLLYSSSSRLCIATELAKPPSEYILF